MHPKSFIAAAALVFTASALALSDVEVLKELVLVAQALSSQLPMGNDSAMIVSTAVGPGRRFTYVVASNLRADQWSEAQKVRHRETKRWLYCDDPEMKFFRDRAVTVVFAVIDDTGAPIDNAVTAPGDCK